MEQTNPRIGKDVNEFEIQGIVRYGFRRYNTFKNKKPYLLFMVQQPFTSKDGKSRFRGYQMLCFVEQYALDLFNLHQQVEVLVKGNVSVESYTKDGETMSVVKLLANEITILEKLPFPFIKSKAELEAEKNEPKVKETIEHTTVFQSVPKKVDDNDLECLPGEEEGACYNRLMAKFK
jgi:hypothetical protein